MAIYHFTVKNISRGTGRSSTAAAAYRAAAKIYDNRTGETHDYIQKLGVEFSTIIAPENSPAWVYDRQKLWNQVEEIEKRKDARLAKEIEVAIPVELSKSQKVSLVEEFVSSECVAMGMIADINFHDLDSHNPHAHIMLTTRQIDGENFGLKNRDWDKKDQILKWRKAWEESTNIALEAAGVEARIDSRSFVNQGITDRIPQIHLGPQVAAMMKKGIETDRGDIYNSIVKTNQELKFSSLQEEPLLMESDFTTESQSESPELIDLYYGQERSNISNDIQTALNLDNRSLNIRTNVLFTKKAISKGYSPEEIKRILVHTEQTASLSLAEAQENIEACYQLALTIYGQDNGESCRLVFSGEEDEISISKIIFCLAKRNDYKHQLQDILHQYGLDCDYSPTHKVFSLYNRDNPNQEYLSAFYHEIDNYYGGKNIEIIQDKLSVPLKKDIFNQLLKLPLPSYVNLGFGENNFTVTDWLKYQVIKNESRRDIPLDEIRITELKTETDIKPKPESIAINVKIDLVNQQWKEHLDRLKELGVRQDDTVTDAVKTYSTIDVENAIALYKERRYSSKIRKPSAYFMLVLQEGWANGLESDNSPKLEQSKPELELGRESIPEPTEELTESTTKSKVNQTLQVTNQIHQNFIDIIGRYHQDLRVKKLLRKKGYSINAHPFAGEYYLTLSGIGEPDVFTAKSLDNGWSDCSSRGDKLILTDEEKQELIKGIQFTIKNEPEIKPEQNTILAKNKSKSKSRGFQL